MPAEVSVSDLALAIEDGAWVLDVREPNEFANGHVPSAHHIPLNSVPDNIHLIPKDERVFVICQSGGRSMSAATFLESHGYQVVSVAGGTGAWIGSGRQVSFDESL